MLAGFSVAAGAFPNGPISVVVPLAPGAGGAVGAASVAQAKKDGQTILFPPNAALTFRAVLEPQVATYDALRDFTPLGISSRTPSVLVVRADAPYKSFAELVDYARKNPGKVRVGHPGPGSVGDFCIRLVNALTDAGLEPVPHAGAAPAVAALRGGHIEGVVLALGALSQHIRSGVFRGLVTSSKVPDYSDIPTLRELGHKDDLFGIWFSFLAPAGIPEETRRQLAGAVEQAVKSPAVAARLAPLGIVQSYAAPDAMTAEIRDELARVAELARKTGLVK
jgi:tripartite-type tricarboxylate transporter receptor subunit TctC